MQNRSKEAPWRTWSRPFVILYLCSCLCNIHSAQCINTDPSKVKRDFKKNRKNRGRNENIVIKEKRKISLIRRSLRGNSTSSSRSRKSQIEPDSPLSNIPWEDEHILLDLSYIPTSTPTHIPTYTSTTVEPSIIPTYYPTDSPSDTLSDTPSHTPTDTPSHTPTDTPSHTPTDTPSHTPTDTPSHTPTDTPTDTPSYTPSYEPSKIPTKIPSGIPTNKPIINNYPQDDEYSDIFFSYIPSSVPTLDEMKKVPPSISPTTKPSTNPDIRCNDSYLHEVGAKKILLKSLYDPTVLDDVTTPQYKAYQWILVDNISIDRTTCNYNEDLFLQRYGLAVLHYSTDGQNWSKSENWLDVDKSECTWFGLKCYGQNVFSRDIRRNDSINNLTSYPLEIDGQHSQLQTNYDSYVVKIKLNENNLQGPLLHEISFVKKVCVIDLFSNKLSSEIPAQIFTHLDKLEALRISSNSFSGNIPDEIEYAKKLKDFWVANNKLEGSIPNIGESSIESLILYRNHLTGKIPSSIGNLSETLRYLDLSYNQLTGSLPQEFYLLSNLEDVHLTKNRLVGKINSSIKDMISLQNVWLGSNRFRGSIPSEIFSLESLKVLYLFRNKLTGPLPTKLEVSSLHSIDISGNQLTGGIPESFYDLQELEFVYLSNNTFSGTISERFSTLSKLQDFFIDGNNFTGTFPDISSPISSIGFGEVSLSPDLEDLLLQKNSFTGTIPEIYCDLPKLNTLMADCVTEVKCTCCTSCFKDDSNIFKRSSPQTNE